MSEPTNVATKIELLLQRCDRLRRGSECERPTRFNQQSEPHAQQVAAADAAVHSRPERRTESHAINTQTPTDAS